MTSRQEQWARLRRQLWQPPRAHGEQPRERVVGPLELFYDLVVVVLVTQAAQHLAGDLDWHGLGLFAAVFALVWIAWLNGSLHHELHGHEDARGRSMFLLQILVLVPLGAFIPDAGGARGVAFAVDAGVLFAVLALLWLLAARGDTPEYRRPSMLFVTGTAVCAVVLAASAALPADARMLTWGLLALAYLAGFVFVIRWAIPERAVVLSVTDALTERFGLGPHVRAPCSGCWCTCRSRPRWPPWAPRWSTSSSTPTRAGPPPPRPGCSAGARPSYSARRWRSPTPCASGARTAGSTVHWPAPASPRPSCASRSAPSDRPHSSWASSSSSPSLSPGDSPSQSDCPTRQNPPPTRQHERRPHERGFTTSGQEFHSSAPARSSSTAARCSSRVHAAHSPSNSLR